MSVWAVLGGGNGGKASAADLAIQGRTVRLFEFPEFGANLAALLEDPTLKVRGAVTGETRLDLVTTDLAAAVEGADWIMVATQALAHERAARELAPLVRPDQIIVLNPGSTGGALRFARVFRELGIRDPPVLVEFGTLTYGCRAAGAEIDCAVKVGRVLYGTLPAAALGAVAPELESLFPGLVRASSVLEAGLTNANPVIHPPITLLNGASFETKGDQLHFYGDGVSPTVARLIEQLDGERMSLLEALGYPALPDPANSVMQGYAASDDYYECYADGPGFAAFTAPNTLDVRYIHEDIGLGLVLYCKLGEVLGVGTPVSDAFVRMGRAISGIDYFERNGDILERLGIAGLDPGALAAYLESGDHPGL
jgi:opine dehydrogenase